MLIGRLTRDPEVRTFANGGKVAKLGFAVNNRKKNTSTGQWEDDPVYLDCEVFNRGEHGKMADLVEQYLRKGSQAYIEGHLKLESWQDKTTGDKKSKMSVTVEVVQFLDPANKNRGDNDEPPPPMQRQDRTPPRASVAPAAEDIPF